MEIADRAVPASTGQGASRPWLLSRLHKIESAGGGRPAQSGIGKILHAAERRVLKPHGMLYAETPFMQQVHERAYDFTRFTANGHRWLFRRFEQIDAGVNRGSGAGPALAWSVRYLYGPL